MSGGIDYSKWDHFDVSDDEQQQQQQETNHDGYQPRVTTLSGPSRITRQSDGTIVVHEESTTTTPRVQTQNKSGTLTKEPPKQQQQHSKTPHSKDSWIENGACVVLEHDSKKLYWSQDRYSVTFRLELEHATRGKDLDVKVKGALPYSERTMATTTTTTTLPTVSITQQQPQSSNRVLLEGTFPHAIYLAQDEDDVDWWVETIQNTKYLVWMVHKAAPMQDVVIWWKRPLVHLSEQTTMTETRTSKQRQEKQAQFQQAWEQAHEQFKANIKKKQQT